MSDNQNSFFDKNTLIAVILTLVIWIGWDHYMAQKYPRPTVSPVSQDQTIGDNNLNQTTSRANQNDSRISEVTTEETLGSDQVTEQFFEYNGDNFSFKVSNRGMGLTDLVLNNFTTRDGEKITFFGGEDIYSYETRLLKDAPLFFNINKISHNEFLGIYENEELRIEKLYVVNEENFTILSNLKIHSKNSNKTPEISKFLVDLTLDEPKTSIFNPSFERQELYVFSGNSSSVEMFHLKKPIENTWNQVAIAALSSHYFTKALIDYSPIIPRLTTSINRTNKITQAELVYPSTNRSQIEIDFVAYIGPKKVDIVENIDARLSDIVDFGFFRSLAKPILSLLVHLYNIFGNYGVAIIILTILVRIAVLPFNIMSYKSMKNMQKIQPLLTSVREKHKEDPTKMNQEVMALMKEHKVNPLGGCLPILLQLPIFIALYQVLGQSIEMYQAPFMWWIQDLSLKDPFFVLPVLMGVTMYLQQKFTPTTLDPTQAKIMMFMPVVFALFMVALPSGLTLYIFISTLFAVIQQKILMQRA